MSPEIQQLVDDTIDLTGAAPPVLLDDDAPLFDMSGAPVSIYLVGLVGGKEVGKSSLVNALVGAPIARPSSFGRGTQDVIAYAHADAVQELRPLLEREVPGRFSIIAHRVKQLRRQVLLDLPDIDSRYDDHIAITRRMLRHLLYPLWIQSVEKYADLAPQQLLAAVAEGNDPANFIFCLNKVDQLVEREGESSVSELAEDYSRRLAKLLKLVDPPTIRLISAGVKPDAFDLPALRQFLSRDRTGEMVEGSRQLATVRQDRTLLRWIDLQDLPARASRLVRLRDDAEQLLTSRAVLPLLERAVPGILDDPGQRLAMIVPATRRRLARWPIVNAIDSLAAPLILLVQKNLSANQSGSIDADIYLARPGALSAGVQAAFAQLHQLHPSLGQLYRESKPWEALHADVAAARLKQRLADTVERQRSELSDRSVGRFGTLLAPLRWLLTIGAVLWFPIVQPILAIMLQQDVWSFSKETLRVAVSVLSVSHLLQCATFLVLWFVILWVLLRWSTQRGIARSIERFGRDDDGVSEELSLPKQVLAWSREMIEPIEESLARADALRRRAAELEARIKA